MCSCVGGQKSDDICTIWYVAWFSWYLNTYWIIVSCIVPHIQRNLHPVGLWIVTVLVSGLVSSVGKSVCPVSRRSRVRFLDWQHFPFRLSQYAVLWEWTSWVACGLPGNYWGEPGIYFLSLWDFLLTPLGNLKIWWDGVWGFGYRARLAKSVRASAL